MDLSNLKSDIKNSSNLSIYKKSKNINALNSTRVTNKPMGRPKIDESYKINAKINLYLTKNEKQKLKELAKQEEISTSNLVRKYLKQANKI